MVDYFQNDIILTDILGNEVDFPHLAATLNAHLYTSSFTGVKLTIAGEKHVDHLSGWAGDLQTLMIDVYNATNESADYDTIYNAAKDMFGCEDMHFSYADFYGDTDAYNISNLIDKNTNLVEAIDFYYNRGYKTRFSDFTSDHSIEDIRDLVDKYVKQSMHVPSVFGMNDWPLTKGYEFSDEFREAMRDAFTDIVWEHVTAEKERNK